MSGGRRDRESKGGVGDDPVEELLREAEDDLLLKLSVNTHTTSSSSTLDPELARRFEALKSPPLPALARVPAPALSPSQPPSRSGGVHDEEMSRVLGDDLSARFAALKGPSAASKEPQSVRPVLRSDNSDDEDEEEEDSVGVSKKEVEKVMQWALDAARLDPSKSDDDNDKDDDEVDEEEENLELKKKAREEEIKGKGKPKKWFFF